MTRPNVRDYYDRSTQAFLQLGQGRDLGAIHRAVWGPGIERRAQAFRFIEDRILHHAPPSPFVVDLGCGVASSLTYLAQRDPSLRGLGVTISPLQAELGRARIAQAELSSRLHCCHGDFTRVEHPGATVDLAFAIESFVHGPDPRAFFAEAARLLRPGGVLIVADDMLSELGAVARGSDLTTIERFRRGWHVQSLLTRDSLARAAREAGLELVSSSDWSRWLELRRPRDRLLAAAVRLTEALPISHPWWASMVGGDALQRGLIAGLLQFRFNVLRRPPTADVSDDPRTGP